MDNDLWTYIYLYSYLYEVKTDICSIPETSEIGFLTDEAELRVVDVTLFGDVPVLPLAIHSRQVRSDVRPGVRPGAIEAAKPECCVY